MKNTSSDLYSIWRKFSTPFGLYDCSGMSLFEELENFYQITLLAPIKDSELTLYLLICTQTLIKLYLLEYENRKASLNHIETKWHTFISGRVLVKRKSPT